MTNARPSTMNVTEEQTGTLGSTRVPAVLSFGWQNSAHQGDEVEREAGQPLRVKTTPAVLAFDQYNQDDTGDMAHTLRSGNVSNGLPAVLAYDTTQVTSAANRSNPRAGDPCHPLAAQQHAPLVVSVTGHGQYAEVPPTLGASGGDCAGGSEALVVTISGEGVTHALTHEGHDASEDGTGRGTPIVFNETGHEKWSAEALSEPLNAHEAKEAHTLVVGTPDARTNGGGFPGSDGAMAGHVQATDGIPRRLMPIECERLMGWPDDWTNVPDEKGKPASDAQRYKACGNGVVSHVPEWIARRLLAMEVA